jgi:hypothetical protein
VKEILHRQNSAAISHQVSPALLLLVIARELWWLFQEWLEMRLGHTADQKLL